MHGFQLTELDRVGQLLTDLNRVVQIKRVRPQGTEQGESGHGPETDACKNGSTGAPAAAQSRRATAWESEEVCSTRNAHEQGQGARQHNSIAIAQLAA